jgi:SAM-dependent methyltransferase
LCAIRDKPSGGQEGATVTQIEPAQSEVLAHYQKLAAEYNQRANQTCERMYKNLVARVLADRSRLLELGSGASEQLGLLRSDLAVACDLSREMLLRRPPGDAAHRVVAVGERLPFGSGQFDGIFSINVMEHVSDVNAVLSESARVLQNGGLWLAITPNGNWEPLLDLAERWSLKIPEGPHRFLRTGVLRQAVASHFTVVVHRTFLVLPAGPSLLSSFCDRVSLCSVWSGGFFQYIVARKESRASDG